MVKRSKHKSQKSHNDESNCRKSKVYDKIEACKGNICSLKSRIVDSLKVKTKYLEATKIEAFKIEATKIKTTKIESTTIITENLLINGVPVEETVQSNNFVTRENFLSKTTQVSNTEVNIDLSLPMVSIQDDNLNTAVAAKHLTPTAYLDNTGQVVEYTLTAGVFIITYNDQDKVEKNWGYNFNTNLWEEFEVNKEPPKRLTLLNVVNKTPTLGSNFLVPAQSFTNLEMQHFILGHVGSRSQSLNNKNGVYYVVKASIKFDEGEFLPTVSTSVTPTWSRPGVFEAAILPKKVIDNPHVLIIEEGCLESNKEALFVKFSSVTDPKSATFRFTPRGIIKETNSRPILGNPISGSRFKASCARHILTLERPGLDFDLFPDPALRTEPKDFDPNAVTIQVKGQDQLIRALGGVNTIGVEIANFEPPISDYSFYLLPISKIPQ